MEIKDLYQIYLRCNGVATDSRKIAGGELFFALKGENFDGNLYAEKSLEAGAAFAVVDAASEVASKARTVSADGNVHGADPSSDDVSHDNTLSSRIIPVTDTLQTLMQLATFHRESLRNSSTSPLTVIGLTGTNGKTTTKELIRSVLSAKYRVSATEGNLNNDIGVPLSLLRIPSGTQIAIIEMGASHPDDIERLVHISRPDCGLITNVGKGHLLGFGSFEGVRRAKGALYDFLSQNGGFIFVNADDNVLTEMLVERSVSIFESYGIEYQGCRILPCDASHPYVNVEYREDPNAPEIIIRTHLVGSYNTVNVLAAMKVGRYFGVPAEDAAKMIESYVPSNNRSQLVKTVHGNNLIVDAYNANPSSMNAALENLGNIDAVRKIVLLGDMKELGDDSLAEHVAVLRKLTSMNLYRICLVGCEFEFACRQCGEIDKVVPASTFYKVNCVLIEHFADSDALCNALSENVVSDATILIKGSNSMKMTKVLPAL